MTPIRNLTIKSFHEGLLSKEFSALEITMAFLKHAKEKNPQIGAYLYFLEEEAIKQAEAVDLAISQGEEINYLTGVPFAIKDNILIKNYPTTAASLMLENYISSYDATVIKKLKERGAIFLGKTNLDEFAMGASTENSAFKITRNPYDKERVPGGSSGGSAAAVAAHMALVALGSDTGGSIRQPASFCGVCGLKPTYGAVSRFGLIAMASSLDQIGPITKTVEDAALVFEAISGRDEFDSTTAEVFYENLTSPDFEKIKNLTIGLPKEYFIEGLDEKVEKAVSFAISKIKSLGLKFKTISLPHTKYAISVYYIIMPAEVSSNLARFDGLRYARQKIKEKDSQDTENSALEKLYFEQRGQGFGNEVKRRIILGTFVLSSGYYDAYYEKAQKVRNIIRTDFENAFREVDIILTPVSPTPAFKLGEKTGDPLAMYLSDIFTVSANLTGLPALSLPTKKYEISDKELPVGFQLIGKPFKEAEILGLGQFYEKIE